MKCFLESTYVDDFEGIRTSFFLAKTVLFTSVLEIQTRFHIKIVFIHNSKSFWSENSQKEDYVKMMYEHDASQAKKNPSLHHSFASRKKELIGPFSEIIYHYKSLQIPYYAHFWGTSLLAWQSLSCCFVFF